MGGPTDLTELPGVGRYTADAVAAFAHRAPVLPEDTNVRRVQARTAHRFGPECAQALMDLGATICLARVPRCGACPWPGRAHPADAATSRSGVRDGSKARSGSDGRVSSAPSRRSHEPCRSSTRRRSPRSSGTGWWRSPTDP